MAKKYRGRDRRPPAAPRDHRARRRQRSGQPRRPGLRQPAAGQHRARTAADVVRAFTVVRDGFGLPPLYAEIDALDNKVDGHGAARSLPAVGRLVEVATVWFLKNDAGDAARRAHRRAAGGAQGAGAEAGVAAARLHEGQAGGAAHGCSKTGARRPSSPSGWRCSTIAELHSRHRADRPARPMPTRRRRKGVLRRQRGLPHLADRGRGARRSRRQTIMTGLRCRGPPMRSARPAAASRCRR